MSPQTALVLVTGMSGAGRSTATRALEDNGWYVVDNLPAHMLPELTEYAASHPGMARLAVVADVRAGAVFDDLRTALSTVRGQGADVRVLFLDASDQALVRRYESSRRPHPLQKAGTILEALASERSAIADLRSEADLVIDTSDMNVHELRRAIEGDFGDMEQIQLRATVMSFGFKYGIPTDADLVADMRFLPNPHWDPRLRDHTGLDADVNDAVVSNPQARAFLDHYAQLLDVVEEGYLREGKRFVTIALGCTGGKHRSVAMAENLAARLVKSGVEVRVVHRDLGRE